MARKVSMKSLIKASEQAQKIKARHEEMCEQFLTQIGLKFVQTCANDKLIDDAFIAEAKELAKQCGIKTKIDTKKSVKNEVKADVVKADSAPEKTDSTSKFIEQKENY